MDLNIQGGECQVSALRSPYSTLDITISDIDENYLDTEEVAKMIKIGTFLDAHGEEIVFEYLKKYYPELFND